MLQPTEWPPASLAPRLAASMMPGPPPVMTVKPASARRRPDLAGQRVVSVVSVKRAEPNTVTHGPTKCSAAEAPHNLPENTHGVHQLVTARLRAEQELRLGPRWRSLAPIGPRLSRLAGKVPAATGFVAG